MCESDWIKYTGNGAEYRVTDEAKFKADVLRSYQTAVELCADICKRYGWNPESKLSNGMYLISSHDEGRRAGLSSAHVDPSHIWPRFGLSMEKFRKDVKACMGGQEFSTEVKWYRVRMSWADEKSQLGAYEILENAKANCPAGYTVFDSNGKAVYKHEARGTQARSLNGLSEAEKIAKVAPLYQEVAKRTGMLASVGLAQFALESGYGTTDLAQYANNLHGMKCSLSGNTWSGSTWNGVSKYNKRTAEQDKNGNEYFIYADFRKYECIEDSIADRAQYYLGAMNGSARRYPGIENLTTAEAQIRAIKAGGYATDVKYVDKLMNIVNRFNLTQYDVPKDKAKPVPAPAPAKTTAEKAVARAVEICGDDSHGYNNDKGKRTGNPDFACSSFIAECWRHAGLNSIPANEYTKNMLKDFKAAGFEDVSNKVNLKTGEGTLAGDVLLIPGKHVEMVVNSKHQLAGARGNATGGAENGKAGDQTGQEIAVADWFDYGWKYCLRYKEQTSSSGWRVRVGIYSMRKNIDRIKETIKAKTGLGCFEEKKQDGVHVYCGSFDSHEKATERKKLLNDAKIAAELEER